MVPVLVSHRRRHPLCGRTLNNHITTLLTCCGSSRRTFSPVWRNKAPSQLQILIASLVRHGSNRRRAQTSHLPRRAWDAGALSRAHLPVGAADQCNEAMVSLWRTTGSRSCSKPFALLGTCAALQCTKVEVKQCAAADKTSSSRGE